MQEKQKYERSSPLFDQASTLRRLMREARPSALSEAPISLSSQAALAQHSFPRVIALTGGKGGVGKTLTTANLGLCLANLGMRVLLVDGDFGLANLDVVMGVRVRHTIDDVLAGERHLSEVVVEGQQGVHIIPASSGVLKVPELGALQKLALLDQIESLDTVYDVVLIDTPAGVSRSVQGWTTSCQDVLVVATPEPTSLADAYATMKILHATTGQRTFRLVVNMASHESEALKVYDRLSSLAEEYLNVRIEYLGCIPFDESVRRSVKERVPFIQKYPFAEASAGVRHIARHLLSEIEQTPRQGTSHFIWNQMLSSQACEAKEI
jgi:flagellar biosynthesis protein FlhG